jgi:hypothetical protein
MKHVKMGAKLLVWVGSCPGLHLSQNTRPESANRQSDRRLSAKSVPTPADRRCHVVSVTDSYGRILGFLDQSAIFSFT